ncbi:MAG TPA: serpin family protein [Rugosimonospora sp.]|nr:serpin family protein [Rugosimonospora sp.]
MRRYIAVLLVLALGGCGATQQRFPLTTAAGVTRQQPAAGAPVAAVAGSITSLGYELTTARGAGNTVVSPLSIAYAFAMARAGAGGDTATQLDRVFGFPQSGLHDAFNAITRQVVTADVPPAKPRKPDPGTPPQPPVVCVGDALFAQQGLPLGAAFLRTLAAQYGTGVHPADFAAGKATGLINDWARRQTAGRITKVFDSLSADTKLVIANTVYLRADWPRDLFAQEPVTSQPFTRSGGGTVQVPTMYTGADLRYAAGPGWQAVEVPYAGGQLVMRILLPAPGRAPGPLLAPQTMAAVAAALQPRPVGLSLPRFDFASDLDLVPALEALGLTAPFGAGADFSGISPGLYVGQAIHRANITVDQWGTEAAAVTGLSFPLAAPAPPRLQLRVDHPFAFAVVHTGTGVPLFMGQVADPSAH